MLIPCLNHFCCCGRSKYDSGEKNQIICVIRIIIWAVFRVSYPKVINGTLLLIFLCHFARLLQDYRWPIDNTLGQWLYQLNDVPHKMFVVSWRFCFCVVNVFGNLDKDFTSYVTLCASQVHHRHTGCCWVSSIYLNVIRIKLCIRI